MSSMSPSVKLTRRLSWLASARTWRFVSACLRAALRARASVSNARGRIGIPCPMRTPAAVSKNGVSSGVPRRAVSYDLCKALSDCGVKDEPTRCFESLMSLSSALSVSNVIGRPSLSSLRSTSPTAPARICSDRKFELIQIASSSIPSPGSPRITARPIRLIGSPTNEYGLR